MERGLSPHFVFSLFAHDTSFTMRFPRVTKIRDDKGPEDCMTMEGVPLCWNMSLTIELVNMVRTFEGRLNRLGRTQGSTMKKKRMKTSARKVQLRRVVCSFNSQSADVPTHFKGVDSVAIHIIGDIFDGLELCICFGAESPLNPGVMNGSLDISKREVEELIYSHGGTCVQNPTSRTFAAIACTLINLSLSLLSDKESLKVKNLAKNGELIVVKLQWIEDCIKTNTLVTLEPKYCRLFCAHPDLTGT